MEYEFNDKRYYPSKASGRWTSEQAMPGDFRTARTRQYIEESEAAKEAQASPQLEVKNLLENLERFLTQNQMDKNRGAWDAYEKKQSAPSFLSHAKDKIGGGVGEILDFLDFYFHKQPPKDLPYRPYKEQDRIQENLAKYNEMSDALAGFGMASAPIRGAKAIRGIQQTKPEAQWSKDLAMNDPLAMYLDRLSGGYHSTPHRPGSIPQPTGFKDQPRPGSAEYSSRLRSTGDDLWSRAEAGPREAASAITKQFGLPESDWLVDLIRETTPKGGNPLESDIVSWLGSDAGLRAAIKKDPGVIERLVNTKSSLTDIGLTSESIDPTKQAWARTTGRPSRNVNKVRGEHYYTPGGDLGTTYYPPGAIEEVLNKAEPVVKGAFDYVATLPGKVSETLSDLGQTVGQTIRQKGSEIADKVNTPGNTRLNAVVMQTLREKGMLPETIYKNEPPHFPVDDLRLLKQTPKGSPQRQGLNDAWGRITPYLEDLSEDYSWLAPVAGVAGAGYVLSKLLPALPAPELTKGQDNPALSAHDINDPEGLMRQRRMYEQQTPGEGWRLKNLWPGNW